MILRLHYDTPYWHCSIHFPFLQSTLKSPQGQLINFNQLNNHPVNFISVTYHVPTMLISLRNL